MIPGWNMVLRNLSLAAITIAFIALPFSVRICHAGLIFFIFLWILEGKWHEKLSVVRSSILLRCILFFALIQVVGILYTENKAEGWFTLEKKIFFFLVPVAIATTKFKWNEKEIRTVFYCFVTACLAGVVFCLFQAGLETHLHIQSGVLSEKITYLNNSYFRDFHPETPVTWLFFSYVGLAKGIDLHPSYFSLYLVFCVVFLLHEILTDKTDGLHAKGNVFLIFLFTLFIILLSTRIMVISLILIYTLIAGYYLMRKKEKVTFVLAALLTIMAFMIYLNPVSRYRNFQEVTRSSFPIKEKTLYKTSAEIHVALWWLGWKSYLKSNPIMGSGTGDVKEMMQKTTEQYAVTNVLGSYDPHNQYLHTLISHGLLGLVILVSCLLFPILRAWYVQDYLFIALTLLVVILCFTESALEKQKGIVFFALSYSLLAFQRQSFQVERPRLNFFRA